MKFNKKEFIYSFIAIFFIAFIAFNMKGVSCEDFFYTFGFANDLNNGLIPYVDYNLIISPLFALIMAPFAKNVILFNIAGSAYMAALFSFIIANTEQHKNLIKCMCCVKILGLVFFEYNTAMITTLIISFIFLLDYFNENSNKKLFIVGFLLSISLLMKHSMPAIVISLLTPILFIYIIKNKRVKDFISYAIGGILPVLILCIAAIICGFWSDMIDATILGVFDFTAFKNFHPTYVFVVVLLVFSLFIFITCAIKYKSIKAISAIIYLLGVPILIIMQDLFHNIYAMLYIISIYSLGIKETEWKYKHINKWIFNKNQIFYFISSFLIACSIFFMTIPCGMDFINQSKLEKYELNSTVLTGNLYTDVVYEFTTKIDKYMKDHSDKKIAVVSEISKIVSLYQNKSYGYLDMILKGNGGTNETQKAINEFNKYDLLIVVSYKSFAVNEEIYEYIEKNYKVVDTIEMFGTSYNVYQVVKL